MMRTFRIVVLLILMLVLVGVSSASYQMHNRQVNLPLDDYRITGDEHVLVNKALHLLVTRCMRTQGYSGIAIPPSVVGSVVPIPVNARRYGVIEEAAVRRFGYHLPEDRGSDKRSAELDDWLAQLGRRAELTLYGTDEHRGCLDNAHATLLQGVPAPNKGLLTDLDVTSFDQSSVDPRVTAAVTDWRTCMREQAMDYANPSEALGDPRWNLDSPRIPDREIHTAVADVRCKNRAGLIEIRVRVETEIQQGHIRRNSDKFARLAEARQAYLRNAERIVERG